MDRADPDPATGPRPHRGPEPPLAHLTRPDGRLQVGVGAGAWLVDGWRPGPASAHDLSTVLVQRLAQDGTERPGPVVRWRLEGAVEPAGQLRTQLTSSFGPEACPATALPRHDVRPGPPQAHEPVDVVVLVSPYAVPAGTARRPDLHGPAVLPVVPQSHRVVVGPWTGLAEGPCLHCLDLHRRDRDADWPHVLAALDDPRTSPVPPRHGSGVLAVVSALVVLLVSGAVARPHAGAGSEPGRAVRQSAQAFEVGGRRPHLVTRRWTAHPACPWHPTASGRVS